MWVRCECYTIRGTVRERSRWKEVIEAVLQPRSQGLSSSRPSAWAGRWEMRYIGRIAPNPPASSDLRGPFASPPPPVESTLLHPCLQLIGTSRSEDAMAEKRCIKSEFAFFRSSSRLFSLTYFVKMKPNPPGVEFLRTVSKFRKRNKIS